MRVPIIVICYNNYKYVKNTVEQLIKINSELEKDITILDNKSTCQETRNYLKNCGVKVMYNYSNDGPWISPWKNEGIYNSLPEKFILTDPDLQFNPNMPANFVDILNEISEKYNKYKVGLALDITDYDKMYDGIYNEERSWPIWMWEKHFWDNKIDDDKYELYGAEIDTTFVLVNKKYPIADLYIRVAGDFTAKHIPWYVENKFYNIYERFEFCNATTDLSTTSKLIKRHLADNYVKIDKNDISLFIKNDESDPNLHFWKNIYRYWEQETFMVFDKFLQPDKVFIDIGAWIGTTCIYAARKSKHVYAVDADIESVKSLTNNCKNNCNNYTIINNAIFNVNDIDIKFGKNRFSNESKLNDSTSQIYLDDMISDQYYTIKTITLRSLIENNNINYSDISLIKVDIEGGEEFILNDLNEIYRNYKVPMYISFHYAWWKNMDIDRFTFLTEDQKNSIRANPFISLLFC